MQGKTKQGFVLSVLLHVGVVVGAFLFTLIKPPEPRPLEIFELVAPPPASPDVPADEPTLDFSAPDEPIPLPQPQVEPPPPKPKPPEPKPKPVETPKPVPPKPKPPEPKPVEKPKPMTIEEFRKLNPQKQKTPTKTPPKPIKVPKVDTRFSPNLRETVVDVDSLTGLSQIQQSELQNYIARLREALKLCWVKPAGMAQSTATDVEFHVAPGGTFSRIRVVRSSGISSFDASVLESFDALGTAGRTPQGKPLHLRLTFKLNDD